MFYVISYDVPDDRRRQKIADVLEGFGTRVQKSVFEVHLEPSHYADLRRRLERVMNPQEDNVRLYRLCEDCRKRVEAVGTVGVTPEPTLMIV
jgi:CRISPR-associated protein Cas2